MASKDRKSGGEHRDSDGVAQDLQAGSRKAIAYPRVVETLIDEFARLPGIGRRSAERLAFYMLKSEADTALALARAIEAVKKSVRHCRVCSNFSDGPMCAVCENADRDRRVVLVVEQPKDLIALEQTGMYKGVYHVLLGRLSPLDGVGAGDITLEELLTRLEEPERNPGGTKIEEVILGLNPTVEGDGTALYLSQQCKSRGVRVSRLARGLPTGSQLEYANKAVLADAIEWRREVE
jgi:recombination protein RecR